MMLVTSYSPGGLHTGLCTSSSVSESRQMITIQTSVQETFREASAASEDVFSQHFETDIQKLETETPTHTSETDRADNLISVTSPSPPSSSPTSDRDSPAKSSAEDHHLTNGSVHNG